MTQTQHRGGKGWVVAAMLADQVTGRRIERVDHMERDDERYPTTLDGISAVNRFALMV